jgi:hypothetical protein
MLVLEKFQILGHFGFLCTLCISGMSLYMHPLSLSKDLLSKELWRTKGHLWGLGVSLSRPQQQGVLQCALVTRTRRILDSCRTSWASCFLVELWAAAHLLPGPDCSCPVASQVQESAVLSPVP